MATLDDVDTLVRHRIAMFTEMGGSVGRGAVEAAFRRRFTRGVERRESLRSP